MYGYIEFTLSGVARVGLLVGAVADAVELEAKDVIVVEQLVAEVVVKRVGRRLSCYVRLWAG